MTKSQVAVTLGLLGGLAAPIVHQQSAWRQVQAALAASASPAAPALAAQTPPAERPSERAEIERLQQQAASLKARLAALKLERPDGPETAPPAAPLLLRMGESVSVFDLGYAGAATPEAAFQSLLTFTRDGDLRGMLGVTALSPRRAEAMHQELASEESRQLLSDQLRKGLLGVVISESVESHEDGSTSEPVVQETWPDNPSGEVRVEILEKEPIDEKRVRLHTRIRRGAEANVEIYTFGQSPSGWKHLGL